MDQELISLLLSCVVILATWYLKHVVNKAVKEQKEKKATLDAD